MKKIAKVLSFILAMIFVLAGMSVSVYAAGEAALTIKFYDDFATVSSCLPNAVGVVNIPSEKNGIPVIMVEDDAFKGCSRITHVNIPSSITAIGNGAFESCTSLTDVVFSGANCNIGEKAFKYCSSLANVTLPSNLKEISNETFCGCTGLVSLDIPETVEVIGQEAFRICTSMAQVNIPASVNVIGKNAFIGCTSVTAYNVASGNSVYTSTNGVLYGPYQSPYDDDYSSPVTDKTLIQYPAGNTATAYTVQAGTVIIGDCAFGNAENISKVTLPSGVKTLDAYAFNESSLSEINIPSSVTRISKQAFGKCKNLKNITIPASVKDFNSAFYFSGIENVTIENGVKTISEKAFEGCVSLTGINIPSSVESIALGAFYGCSALGDIEIPASVTAIGNGAFTGCRNVKLIVERNSFAHQYAVNNSINYKIKQGGGDVPTTQPTTPSTKPTTKPSEAKKVVSMSIEKLPDKLDYYYKESVNTSGMQLEIVYSDGSTRIVNSGFKVSPSVCTERGTQTVEVEYAGFTDTYQINVSFSIWQWIIWILLLGFIWY